MTPADLRVLFMGTPDFAVPTLQALVDLGCQVVGVVSQPDRPKGRGQQVIRTPVAARADALGLPVHQWPRLNNDSYTTLSALKPDLSVVVAYGKILPKRYLVLPRFGCFNVHASLLPRWRGAAPIQRAVMAGDALTGVTVQQMDEGMDTGDILHLVETPIGPEETSGALHDRLSPMGAEALAETVKMLCAEALSPVKQPEAGITMADRLSKADGQLDWSRPAQELDPLIRGVHPWPGAWVPGAKGPFKIHSARLAEGEGPPGQIIALAEDGPVVACGVGALALTRVQRPGRQAVSGAEYIRGYAPSVGQPLES